MSIADISTLEAKIGYTFHDKELVRHAMVHTSYANETKESKNKGISNERLEFLGDAVLQIAVSDYLYFRYPDHQEGMLTQLRQHIVCEGTLSHAARRIDLGSYILLGRGEEANGGRNNDSILADAFESLLAAIYIDSGRNSNGVVYERLLSLLDEEIEDCVQSRGGDYKTKLQQIVQQGSTEVLRYVMVEEKGPAHNPEFVVNAMLNSNVIGTGKGRSKREAEQQAARNALDLFGEK